MALIISSQLAKHFQITFIQKGLKKKIFCRTDGKSVKISLLTYASLKLVIFTLVYWNQLIFENAS